MSCQVTVRHYGHTCGGLTGIRISSLWILQYYTSIIDTLPWGASAELQEMHATATRRDSSLNM